MYKYDYTADPGFIQDMLEDPWSEYAQKLKQENLELKNTIAYLKAQLAATNAIANSFRDYFKIYVEDKPSIP